MIGFPVPIAGGDFTRKRRKGTFQSVGTKFLLLSSCCRSIVVRYGTGPASMFYIDLFRTTKENVATSRRLDEDIFLKLQPVPGKDTLNRPARLQKGAAVNRAAQVTAQKATKAGVGALNKTTPLPKKTNSSGMVF